MTVAIHGLHTASLLAVQASSSSPASQVGVEQSCEKHTSVQCEQKATSSLVQRPEAFLNVTPASQGMHAASLLTVHAASSSPLLQTGVEQSDQYVSDWTRQGYLLRTCAFAGGCVLEG